MKIALIVNRLVQTPTIEEQMVNARRRERNNRIILDAVHSLGYEIQLIEPSPHLRKKLEAFQPDLVFFQTFRVNPDASILEVLLELEELNIPYTGSPPASCELALNKFATKQKLIQENLPTPAYTVVESGELVHENTRHLRYPLFIKPLFGGCSMGILPDNPVNTKSELERVLPETISCTKQPVLVEEFIGGREFTIGVLGNQPPTALPIIEFVYLTREKLPVLFRNFDAKTDALIHEVTECPAKLKADERALITHLALSAYRALGCRDYARVDIRCDQIGNPYVLEVNVHPSLLPESSLAKMADAASMEYLQLIDRIIQYALSRADDI